MSDYSLKRSFLLISLSLLAAANVFASSPSARYETQMVFDPTIHRLVLYGGSTALDKGTKQAYELGDTWEWTGARWLQIFPAHTPGTRAGQSMVYDSARSQALVFGGRRAKTNLNDTWVFKNGDWTQISTPDSPPVRVLGGMAYDPVRDRTVLFGGTQQQYSADGRTVTNVGLHDTWEFDGTTWHEAIHEGLTLGKPILVYDAAHNQVLALGLDDKSVSQMYAYDPANAKWNQLKPATIPACVNEGMLVFNAADNAVMYTGGVCTGSTSTEDNYEWDGSNWVKIDVTAAAGRLYGAALAFDTDTQQVVMFGGTPVSGVPLATTIVFANKAWVSIADVILPSPRSLFGFTTDLATNNIFMYGGVDDSNQFADLWRFDNGSWSSITDTSTPTSCAYPSTAYDTDRQRLVLLCESSATWEFDGTTWFQYTPKNAPPTRRFSNMVYDQTLKKTVTLGGYGTDYSDETWMWDGTDWTRQSHNPPTSRALTAMWYDPTLKKTVIYGGIGRLTRTDRITRYDDMWTFDGTGWTPLTPSGGTPGLRYGAQVAVDPRTNHLVLFGGIRVDTVNLLQVQSYVNDTWEWDGSAWSKITTNGTPPARENAGFTFDPLRNELVMFGGYAGYYFSEAWGYTNGTWHFRDEPLTRRRAAGR